jgi:hypothetical protein
MLPWQRHSLELWVLSAPFEQRLGASQIVNLTRREHHLDGIAERIDADVNLGVSPPRDWLIPGAELSRRPGSRYCR